MPVNVTHEHVQVPAVAVLCLAEDLIKAPVAREQGTQAPKRAPSQGAAINAFKLLIAIDFDDADARADAHQEIREWRCLWTKELALWGLIFVESEGFVLNGLEEVVASPNHATHLIVAHDIKVALFKELQIFVCTTSCRPHNTGFSEVDAGLNKADALLQLRRVEVAQVQPADFNLLLAECR